MAVPNHNFYCQTWMYKTSCWSCATEIFVFQCSCGSAVLFNNDRPPFDEHTCSGGIGDSGLSGWNAIDVLRNAGMPITAEVMDKAFDKKPKATQKISGNSDIKKISPIYGENREIIMNIAEFQRETKETTNFNNLSAIAREMEGVPKDVDGVSQITLMYNNDDIRESYTALLPVKLIPKNIEQLKKSRSVVFVKLLGLKSWWLVDNIEPL